jgi:hypothetical protein
MDEGQRVDDIREMSARLHLLACRVQNDVNVARRLPDGRVLAPTCAEGDLDRFVDTCMDLRRLLTFHDGAQPETVAAS